MLNQIQPIGDSVEESDGVPDSSICEIVGPTILTRHEVSLVKDRTLLVYQNEVFDVSNYLDLHPGGSKYLVQYAGKDISQEYDQVGHSNKATTKLRSFKIGDIDPTDVEQVHEFQSWTEDATIIGKQ